MSKEKEYALYKGEELIMIGTAEEIAKARGIKKQTVCFLASPVNHKRADEKRKNKSKGRQLCILLDEMEE